ncbi:MAG: radical SAM protein [Deltaproteobacteria bacterium]|nr:radical SAM protein [Deltaproteobacteria bacterium]
MSIFGPVPSRRLGRSLGINTIPVKVCSYSCVYCQVGRTRTVQITRRRFCHPETIAAEVKRIVDELGYRNEAVDYLTFVADGEPTLDINLGRMIELLKPLGIKIAVITNSSLIWRADVRAELSLADWVSLKVDTVNEELWRTINQPDRTLRFDALLSGMISFSKEFNGVLATETMLLRGINDADVNLDPLATFLAELKPAIAYVAVPIRPPAEQWVAIPKAETLNRAVQIIGRKIDRVEYLTGYEGNSFASSGDAAADLLSITGVHPMREDAVQELLAKAHADWSCMEQLIGKNLIQETEYEGRKFFLRMKPCTLRSPADKTEVIKEVTSKRNLS